MTTEQEKQFKLWKPSNKEEELEMMKVVISQKDINEAFSEIATFRIGMEYIKQRRNWNAKFKDKTFD